MGRAKADGSADRTVARICRADLIVIDDMGMLPVGQDSAEAFYRIVDTAYERRSIAVGRVPAVCRVWTVSPVARGRL